MNSSLKKKIRGGGVCLGSWITLGSNGIAEILSNAGYDWLVVDLEHSTISLDQAGELIRTIELARSVPLVRLTSNDPNQIKRVLDAGAHGIIVPNIRTTQEAINAVRATRYSPEGFRGVGLGRAQQYGPGFKKYFETHSDELIVIVMIEDVSAIEYLPDILTVPGVDGFIIGPYDLSCSMGIAGQFDSPQFISTLQTILNAGKEAGCPAGIHIVEPDTNQLANAVNQGYKLIAYGVDIRMLDVAARKGIEFLKSIVN